MLEDPERGAALVFTQGRVRGTQDCEKEGPRARFSGKGGVLRKLHSIQPLFG